MKISAFSVELNEGGDAHWKLYRLTVVTGEAEHQEGGGVARAWIIDPKVGIPMTQ